MRAAAILTRAAIPRAPLFWIGIRLIVFLLGGLAGAHPLPPWAPSSPAGATLTAAATALLVHVDVRVVHEDVLLANLGIGARNIIAMAFATALALEAACALAFG